MSRTRPAEEGTLRAGQVGAGFGCAGQGASPSLSTGPVSQKAITPTPQITPEGALDQDVDDIKSAFVGISAGAFYFLQMWLHFLSPLAFCLHYPNRQEDRLTVNANKLFWAALKNYA